MAIYTVPMFNFQLSLLHFALKALCALALVGAQPIMAQEQTLAQEIAPPTPVQIIERLDTGEEVLLLPDRGRSGLKLFQCLQARLPGYPVASLNDIVLQTQPKFLRIVNDVLYVPAVFLITPCAESSMVAFLDRLDIPSAAHWLPLVRGEGRQP